MHTRFVVPQEDPIASAADASAESIGMVVAMIQQMCRDSSLEFALRVGGVIVHHFYDGDTSAWRARGPKTNSFRRLASHPGLPMSPGTLYRCVAIFELCDRLDAVSRWRNLSATHLRVVLRLPPDSQEKVLQDANKNRWSVHELEDEVRKYKPQTSPRGGRRPRSQLGTGLDSLRKWIDTYSPRLCEAGVTEESEFLDALRTVDQTRACIAQVDELLVRIRRQLIRDSDADEHSRASGAA
jgi:hypothetical protein